MQNILACWIHGSLMILTVNPFVALMFRAVSLSPDVLERIHEKDMTGGELDTYNSCRCADQYCYYEVAAALFNQPY